MENKVDKKAELIENVQTSVGKLFKGEKVTVMTQENGTYRVTDGTGKLWFVPKGSVKFI
jgi:uncharacterized protein YgiM (DUF1202 family)